MKGNSGFTLLESLIVMLCISVFFLVPLIMIKNWKEQLEVTMFLNKLERGIEKTHQSAIIESHGTSINQKQNSSEIIFNYWHHQKKMSDYLKVEYPFVLKTNETIDFKNTTGNISKLQVIKLRDELNKKEITYKFQIGSGKVIKSEKKL
ncbi:competence type IV pilus minor pilin ComGD [Vagococcus fluvialis]|uniref:competence type IV pilus minor pilin ComGD n=1 Tax=Vagococcus fluvialis TaxID=2738 RepID=UPI001A8DF9FF|nr:competence type IV pilus minor pilin ComGD [Vagococcus fluvialis]MBO0437703.1 type II secretion system protein [Vagococcus fluvialis]